MAAATAMMCLGAGTLMAQNDNNGGPGGPGGPGGGGGGGRGGRGNFDPSQFRQRMLDNTREMLEVKDDAEWKELEPRVQKVMDTRREAGAGVMRGMGRMFGRGGRGGDQGGGNDSGGRSSRTSMFGGQSSPEADALQKAIDSKASKAEIKTALQKYMAARKAKEAELQQAQEKLRELLSPRQEAIATLNGLL